MILFLDVVKMLAIQHNKCLASSFCNFCLLRSVILRINLPKGRQSIKPPEVECRLFKAVEMTYIDVLKVILDNASQSYPSFSNLSRAVHVAQM